MLSKFRTYQLALKLYEKCEAINVGHLRDQLLRASSSIVLNLAEGSAKSSIKDRKRYYSIALGSLREVQAILDLKKNANLFQETNHLGACLYKLSRKHEP